MQSHTIVATILGVLFIGAVNAQNATNTTATNVNALCPICPNGLTVSGNSVIPRPEANGITCDRLLVLATIGVRPSVCDEMRLAEPYCCPPLSDTPCDVCVSGITVDGNTSISENSQKTCDDLLIDAKVTELDSEVCAQMKLAELACCPAAPVDPCEVCPGGVPETTEGVEITGKTCADIAADAVLVESTSEICPQLKLVESVCCPPLPNTTLPTSSPTINVTVFESCPVCSGGITAPPDTEIGTDGRTCGTLLADANVTAASSVACSLMQDTQLTCCPTSAVTPCPVCADGITVATTTPVGTQGKTCADMLVDVINTEADSETCTNINEVAGPVCCPPPGGAGTTSPTAAIANGTMPTTTTPTVAPGALMTEDETSSPVVVMDESSTVITGVPSIIILEGGDVMTTLSPLVLEVDEPTAMSIIDPTNDLTFTEPSGTDMVNNDSTAAAARHMASSESFALGAVLSSLCVAVFV